MDTIGDFLTRLRNALAARHKYVDVPASKLKLAMGEILREQGYIESIDKIDWEARAIRLLIEAVCNVAHQPLLSKDVMDQILELNK